MVLDPPALYRDDDYHGVSGLLRGKALPIAVLSTNPAVDMTYEFPQLIADQKVHAVATRFDPCGNGINVGRALKRLETAAQNYCVVAGEIGGLLKCLIADRMDGVDYEEVVGETRIDGTFIGRSPRVQYEVSGIGPEIPPSRLNELLGRFVEHGGIGFGVLTGSLQQELPPTLYAELASRISEHGGRGVVDTHDEALSHAIEAKPYLIKPSRYELESLLACSLESTEAVATEARKLQRRGVEYVCVSLGDEGVLLVGPENSYHANAPEVLVRSSVGAGDSIVAALVAALARGETVQDALRLGVACAAGTVSQPGTELFSAADVDNYLDGITVRCLNI